MSIFWVSWPEVRKEPTGYLPELVMGAAGLIAIVLAHGDGAYAQLFWGDEIMTAGVIQQAVVGVTMTRYAVAHSPLYFSLPSRGCYSR